MEFLVALKVPLIIVQIIISPLLIGAILLQSGKGDDLGSALGGAGGGSSVLGTGGTSKVLVKATVYLSVMFMVVSIMLAVVFKEESSRSVGTSVSEPLVPANLPVDDLMDGSSAAPAESEAAPAEESAEPAPAE